MKYDYRLLIFELIRRLLTRHYCGIDNHVPIQGFLSCKEYERVLSSNGKDFFKKGLLFTEKSWKKYLTEYVQRINTESPVCGSTQVILTAVVGPKKIVWTYYKEELYGGHWVTFPLVEIELSGIINKCPGKETLYIQPCFSFRMHQFFCEEEVELRSHIEDMVYSDQEAVDFFLWEGLLTKAETIRCRKIFPREHRVQNCLQKSEFLQQAADEKTRKSVRKGKTNDEKRLAA